MSASCTEQRFKVPVRFTHPVTGEITEEQMEVTPDAFVKVAARVGRSRTPDLPPR